MLFEIVKFFYKKNLNCLNSLIYITTFIIINNKNKTKQNLTFSKPGNMKTISTKKKKNTDKKNFS